MRTPSTLMVACLIVLPASVHAASPTWSVTAGTFQSPNGRYQVSVLPCGTTNAAHPSHTIVLTDGKTGTELWRRTNKVCLAGFLVRNNGTVWVDDWDYIHGIDTNNESLTETRLEWMERFPRKYHVHTSNGIFWSWPLSFRYFVEHDGKPYFCVRPWWDQRLLIDLEMGQYVDDKGSVRDILAQTERRWVVETLTDGVTNRVTDIYNPHKRGHVRDWIKTALRIAGASGHTNAIPLLKDYEGWERGSGENEIRALAQLSLRRLGVCPRDLPTMQGMLRWNDERLALTSPTNRLSREARTRLLVRGMTAQQALDALGPPDFFGLESWDLHVDATNPCTFRITWTNRIIDTVEEIRPPTWSSGDTEDYYWLESTRR